MNKLLISMFAVAGLSTAAFAGAPMAAPMYHWYTGIGFNHDAGTTETRIYDNTHPSQLTRDKYSLSSTKVGYNLFIGNRVTRHFGTELGLNVIGDRKYKHRHVEQASPSNNYTRTDKIKNAWSVYYDGVFTLPVYSNFSVYGKAGVNYYRAKSTGDYDSGHHSQSGSELGSPTNYYKNSTQLKAFGWNYGGGVQFVYNQFGLRGDYTHMNFSETQEFNYNTPNIVSVDAFYCFG